MTVVFLFGVFAALMAFAAAYDLTTMTIPNRLTAAVALAFVAVAIWCRLSPAEIAWHLGAGFVVLVVAFAMFAAGWIGGGDAKLAAAAALWFGFANLLDYLLLAGLMGGALTVILLGARQLPLPASLARFGWVARLHDARTGIPYGIALAAAALTVLPHAEILLKALPA
jgi:prepilin peptidase CpaA